MSTACKYRRIVLKASGEGLAGEQGFGLSSEGLHHLAEEIRQVHALGVQVGVVVGGGNFIRGAVFAKKGQIPEATAHHMGMLATVINALALAETLESLKVPARVMSAVPVATICEPFVRRRCIRQLEKGRVVILAGGTGRPFVTTDTAGALAAAELSADALLKATQVDAIYSDDPRKNPDAQRHDTLSYDQVINDRLKVMDLSAVELCQRAGVPIVVFNLHVPGNMARLIQGETIGTLVS